MFTFNLPEPFARKRTHVPQQINFCKSTATIFMLSAGEIWKAFCADGGKRCSWEHVAVSGCPRKQKKKKNKQCVPMPAALMLFKQWRHMQSLHQLSESRFFNWLCSPQITHVSKASLPWPLRRFRTGGIRSNPGEHGTTLSPTAKKSVIVRRWHRVNIKVSKLIANLLMSIHSRSIFCRSMTAKPGVTTLGLRHCLGNDGHYYSIVIVQIHSWWLEYHCQWKTKAVIYSHYFYITQTS